MELYAAGFNAWNQLCFGKGGAPPVSDEPADIHAFTKVLEADTIQRPVSRLSYTLVGRGSSHIDKAGIGPESEQDVEFAYTSVQTATGESLHIQGDADRQRLVTYPSEDARRSGHAAGHSWPCKIPVKQVAAFDAGFVILYDNGTVATLGDARYEDCLGRDLAPDSPAVEPALVPDLADLGEPIKHVAAGGYTLAALTEGGGIYTWGRASVGTHRRQQAFSTLSGVPNYVEVDGDKDVRDVAVGDSHAVALTTDGAVYVIGDNGNGQLGLGEGFGQRIDTWTKVDLEKLGGAAAVGVAAGPRASFILTHRVPSS